VDKLGVGDAQRGGHRPAYKGDTGGGAGGEACSFTGGEGGRPYWSPSGVPGRAHPAQLFSTRGRGIKVLDRLARGRESSEAPPVGNGPGVPQHAPAGLWGRDSIPVRRGGGDRAGSGCCDAALRGRAAQVRKWRARTSVLPLPFLLHSGVPNSGLSQGEENGNHQRRGTVLPAAERIRKPGGGAHCFAYWTPPAARPRPSQSPWARRARSK